MTETPKNNENSGRDPRDEGELFRRRIGTLKGFIQLKSLSEKDRDLHRQNLEETMNRYNELIQRHPEALELSAREKRAEKVRRVWTAAEIKPKSEYL